MGRDGTEARGGGSAVVRLSSGCLPPTLRGGGGQVLLAMGGNQFAPRVMGAGGLRGLWERRVGPGPGSL